MNYFLEKITVALNVYLLDVTAKWEVCPVVILLFRDVETAALPTSQLELVAVDNAVCGKSSAQSGDAMLRLVSWYCLHPVPDCAGSFNLHLYAERSGELGCGLEVRARQG